MNAKQKCALWAGIVVMVLMGIYPPWVLVVRGTAIAMDYGWLFKPPGEVQVDLGRLFVQWVLVGLVTGAAIWTLKGPQQ